MIKVLSEDTIQKIAAGEVVERPASVVKELVENSIDAGSTNIVVEINNGGKSYIKVSDNGHGIDKDDIELAFKRHATSKIESFEDLYKIYSMGFRGEALASIVSVSRLTMRTKTEKDVVGTMVKYDNNKLISTESVGMNTGTIIEIFDIFNYLPARKKFLASDITEANKITNLMYSFAIGHPEISFTYIKDNREMFRTIAEDSKKSNYETLFGRDFVKNSIELDIKSDNYKIDGTISNNKFYKGNRSMQFIYVNGRYIENEQIVEAIENAYNNLIPAGRFPLFDIKIEVSPDLIDINIHPNKQKIKFSFSEQLFDLLNKKITELLYLSDENKNISLKEKDNKVRFYELNHGDGYKNILDIFKNDSQPKTDDSKVVDKDNTTSDATNSPIIDFREIDDKLSDEKINCVKNENKPYIVNDTTYDFENLKQEEVSDLNEKNDKEQIKFIDEKLIFKTILFNKYILFENNSEKKLVFVDIVRANERILFDREMKKENIVSQKLLEPIIINLTKKELDIFEQNKESFESIGYEIDLFSNNAIIIRQVPYFLDKPGDKTYFLELFDEISNKNSDKTKEYLLRKTLSLSINKNTNLSEIESETLYKELLKTTNPNTSPHGNPIIFNIDYDVFMRLLK
ncbi:DNA mismatch repair endonuclease MutL [Helcococcus kunzii]|uniref:DNA mismatch repair protein MutL n=1 Tax=Helcococcus kunzii ATCC 51366 TaxID=883114 RepID=H3NN58_9FIRM|nr:DNA mismatch repair endonuclease MutL [Helcococcus kunzii]EHR34462.1 DNA mismatch repair protein MutL [Helcococcus kunzii ATCC 51366]QZO77116.1 DNA mismatch repair endonuclease MutL [Helcococcus kunzii]